MGYTACIKTLKERISGIPGRQKGELVFDTARVRSKHDSTPTDSDTSTAYDKASMPAILVASVTVIQNSQL